MTRPGAIVGDDDIAAWSDWLQRRVVAEAASDDLLAALARVGRTRRVRAAARVRAQGGGPPPGKVRP